MSESSEFNTKLDTIEIIGPATVGFNARDSLPSLKAHVGTIIGNDDSLVRIDQYVELMWGTRVGKVDELTINTNVYIRENGKIELPKAAIIDKGWSLDVCGAIVTNLEELTVRENGALKMSNPASDLHIDTLTIDYQGRLEASDYCDTTSNKVTLQLVNFYTTSDFTLNLNKFSLSVENEETINPIVATDADEGSECPSSGIILLNRTQYCTMPRGTHEYTSITIYPEAEIRIDGNMTVEDTTIIKATNMYIYFGGMITGIGKGHQTGGSGSSEASGQGATHGGRGVTNTKSTYGSIKEPMEYGSNGFSATESSGRGGGQVKLEIKNTISIGGTIDMSADSGTGGSGGSIFVNAKTIEGDGYIKAEGSSGGGGGRIAVVASSSYTFTGTLSTVGGEDSSSNKGSAGRNYIVCVT